MDADQVIFAAVTGLFALSAVWVLAARPRERLNQLLAASLLLLAGSSLAFQALRAAPLDPAAQAPFTRLFVWYEVPLTFFLLLALDELFLPKPRTRARRWALLAAGVGCAALLAPLALAPDLYTGALPQATPLGLLQQGALYTVETLAVVLAARAARSAEASPLQRRQAAVVGMGFAFPMLHAGVGGLSNLLLFADRFGERLPLQVLIVALFLVALASLPHLVRVFEGRWRGLAAVAVALPVLGGVYEQLFVLRVVPLEFWLPRGTRPFWHGAFALALALAVVRYGLAGIVPDARRHVARVTSYAFALAAVGGGVALGLDAFGPSPVGTAVAAVGVAVGLLLVLRTPLRRLPRGLADRVVLDAARPEVEAERLRLYLSAMRAARGPGGAWSAEAERVLRDLRGELRISGQSHDVLAALLEEGLPRDESSKLLLGRYVVQRDLSRGGSGRVSLAMDLVIGRVVVLKRLEAGGRPEALLHEMRALGSLNHPRILTLYHAEQVGDRVYLVLEHAPGGSVAEWLETRGPLSPAEAVAVAGDVLEALEAVHGAGLVHGDVKAGNVLRAADGRAKLADFGTARAHKPSDPDATARLPESTATLGSAAPEQLRGEPAQPASDLYAVGVLLFRTLTGEHYIDFSGLAEAQAVERVLTAPPRLPHARVPPGFAPVLARALAKEPAGRFGSAAEMRAALLAAARPSAPALPSAPV